MTAFSYQLKKETNKPETLDVADAFVYTPKGERGGGVKGKIWNSF